MNSIGPSSTQSNHPWTWTHFRCCLFSPPTQHTIMMKHQHSTMYSSRTDKRKIYETEFLNKNRIREGKQSRRRRRTCDDLLSSSLPSHITSFDCRIAFKWKTSWLMWLHKHNYIRLFVWYFHAQLVHGYGQSTWGGNEPSRNTKKKK